MEIAQHIAALSDAGTALADAAGRAGLAAKVPSCPKWTVRDLVFHTGGVHRWATAVVVEALQEPPRPLAMDPVADSDGRPADDELIDWFRNGHNTLVKALQDAPPDLDAWRFLRDAPSTLAFWARRQAHETTIHRVDAEQATGAAVTPIDAHLAADGVDELLAGMLTRRKTRLRTDKPTTVAVRASDVDAAWHLTITREVPVVERVAGDAAATISGTAQQLYLALWNRAPMNDLQIDGDRTLIDRWTDLATV